MNKLLLCFLVSGILVGCSIISESESDVGTPYVATDEVKVVIGKPRVEFDHGTIIITPNIRSYFQKYQDVQLTETTVEKNPTARNHTTIVIASLILLGLPPLISAISDFSMYKCDGALRSNGEPSKNTINCSTTSADKGIKKINVGEISENTYYDNSNVLITIKSNHGEVTLPLSKDHKIHTSLEELNNPDNFTIVVSYQNESEEFDFDVPMISKTLQQSVSPGGFVLSNKRDLKNSLSNYANREKLTEKYTLKKINDLFDEYIEGYIATIKAPKIPDLEIFPEIKPPQLPSAPVLDKSQFETKSAFQQRVQIALDERNKNIKSIQTRYRQTVEKRNDQLESYIKQREKEVSKLVNDYNLRKVHFNRTIPAAKVKQTAYAFKEVLGSPYLDELNYDAEMQTLYGTIKMTQSEYQKKISIQMPVEDAKFIFKKQKQVPVALTYQIVNDEVKLDKISVYKEDRLYLAKINNTEYKAEEVRVVINTAKALNKGEHLQAIDIGIEKATPLQNPNLMDGYSIGAATFVRNQELQVGKAAFNDDIPTLLKKTKTRAVNKKRWLFVVGIENYQQTDNIKYARRSAELFIDVAQKKLGISKRNTYSLIDEQATVGQIKDKMNLMLKNVNKGDDIYFYYNGHGIPDPQDNNTPYILASDKIPDFVTDDSYFKLENFYQQLTDSKAGKVVAFVDSCFSGSTDGVAIIKGVAASRLAPKKVSFDQNKMVVISAGSKKQYSNVYLDKGNRLFSYFIMKELLNDERQVSAIYKGVRKNVRDTSLDMGDLKLQEPSLSGNRSISL